MTSQLLTSEALIELTLDALIDDVNRLPSSPTRIVAEETMRGTVETAVHEAVKLGVELAATDISRQLDERGIDLGFTVERLAD